MNSQRLRYGPILAALAACAAPDPQLSDSVPMPMPASVLARQHEAQLVVSTQGLLAASWTDDTAHTGVDGWTCRFSVSRDRGASWSTPLTFKRAGYQLSGNPTVAIDAAGTIYALCMSVDEGYGKGSLDLASSRDGGTTWSAWTTVAERTGGIPDRPKMIAAADDSLHVVFTDVVQTGDDFPLLTTTIQHTSSTDHGATWRVAEVVSRPRPDPGGFIDGYQGASIRQRPDGTFLIAYGDYYGRGLHVVTVANGKLGAPVDVTGMLPFAVPCTESASDRSGNHVVVTVHEGHAIGRTELLTSSDGGTLWTIGSSPSAHGSNFSLTYDSKDRLHAIWLEHDGTKLDTLYATSLDHGRTFSKAVSLAGGGYPVSTEQVEDEQFAMSLGSYQSLIIDKTDRLYGLWVDFRTAPFEPHLYFNTWSAR